MTIETTNNRVLHTGDGIQTVFPYDYRVDVVTEMNVYQDGVLEDPGNYTVEGIGQDNGGTVTFTVAAPAVGVVVTLQRITDTQQTTDYPPYGPFPAESHEAALDKLTKISQQQADEIERSLKAGVATPVGVNYQLPSPEPDATLAWSSDGTEIVNGPSSQEIIDAEASASQSAADAAASAAEAEAAAGVAAIKRQDIVATEGQTVFNITNAYIQGNGSLTVFLNGLRLSTPTDYTETSTTSFTLVSPAFAGDVLQTQVGNPLTQESASDAANVSYDPGAGAVVTNVQTKLRESVSVKDFGAVGDGVADDTAAIQAAINTGLNIDFVGKTYLVTALTQSTNGQALFSSSGMARLVKGANGVVLTSSGDDVLFENMKIDGESATYTGNNWNVTGNRPIFNNCGSRDAAGRALLATGARVVINGSGDIWQTTDATATGYDIEIGISGTATLYHHLEDIYTAQITGGIKFVDTGSHTLVGGQYGKLKIEAGTKPSGVNGGKTIGGRILGAVDVEISKAIFVGNQFSTQAVTFAAATSGCSLDASNTFSAGATITNNGNSNNLIIKNTSDGSFITLRFGDDVSGSTLRFAPNADGEITAARLAVTNNVGLRFRNAADDGENGSMLFSAAGDLSVNNTTTDKTITLGTAGTGSGSRTQVAVNGVVKMLVNNNTGSTGGTGSAGPGNQYVELELGGVKYKLLHDGTI